MKQLPKRILMSVIGVLLCGVAVAMLRTADMGTDPYTVFILGIANLMHSTYHTVYIVMTALLLLVTVLLDRKFIGIATVINLFLIGPGLRWNICANCRNGFSCNVIRQNFYAAWRVAIALRCILSVLHRESRRQRFTMRWH